MNELNAILRQIIMEPQEDLHRLVYADRLEERGEPGDQLKAEFIRCQCQLAVMEKSKEHDSLDPRLVRLWHQHFGLWEQKIHEPLVELPGGTRYSCCGTRKEKWPSVWLQSWERGFCEELRYSAECFLEIADALIWHPTQTVECPTCKGEGAVAVTGKARAYQMSSICFECRDGQKPRPCPPTAHPIRKVVLTTVTTVHEFESIYNRAKAHLDLTPYADVRQIQKKVFEAVWPGVEFELPPGTTANVGAPDEHLSYP